MILGMPPTHPDAGARIIGFLGKSGSGKDTAADYLTGYDFAKVAFADVLKRIARDVWDFSEVQLWGPQEFKNAPDERYPTASGFLTPRTALQLLGTEVGRGIWTDTWATYTLRVANELLAGGRYYSAQNGLSSNMPGARPPIGVVISDVRFENEVRLIHEAGGKVIHLYRPGRPALAGGIAGHASETEMESIRNIDATITVPEGILAFQHEIRATLRQITSLSKLFN